MESRRSHKPCCAPTSIILRCRIIDRKSNQTRASIVRLEDAVKKPSSGHLRTFLVRNTWFIKAFLAVEGGGLSAEGRKLMCWQDQFQTAGTRVIATGGRPLVYQETVWSKSSFSAGWAK